MSNSNAQSTSHQGTAEDQPTFAICRECKPLGRCVLGIQSTFRAGEGCKATDTGKTAVYAALKKKDKSGKPLITSYRISGRIVDGASWCRYVRGRRDEPGEKRKGRKPSKAPSGPTQRKSEVPTTTATVPVSPDLIVPPAATEPFGQTGQQPCPPPPPPPAQASSDQQEAAS